MHEEDPAGRFAEQAERAYNEGDVALALHLLTQALARRPGDPILLKRRARVLVDLERFVEAERDAGAGLREAPDDPDLLLYHGSALVARAEFRAALADFQRLRALLPHNANLHVNCAEMSLWLSDFATARSDFEEALVLDPKNVAAHFGLARVAAMQHHCAESRIWLTRLLELRDPAAAPLLLEIGEDSCFAWCREQMAG
ncbi:MAG TPA: tetratricopeptide repeat protein [Chloroflexia bacterium]|nr:tetratricopeptide repeat protein [Chloroflexia bacterium]